MDFFSVVPLDSILLFVGMILVKNSKTEAQIEFGDQIMELSVGARLLRLLRLVRLAKIKQLAKTERVVHNVYLLLKGFGVTKLQVRRSEPMV